VYIYLRKLQLAGGSGAFTLKAIIGRRKKMTRKHFIMLAKECYYQQPKDKTSDDWCLWNANIIFMSKILRMTYPRFDGDKFINMCLKGK